MNNREEKLVDSLKKFPERPVKINAMGIQKLKHVIKRVFWYFVHIIRCGERNLTEPSPARYCIKCKRFTIKDKELRRAFKEGGMQGLLEKYKEQKEQKGQRVKVGKGRSNN